MRNILRWSVFLGCIACGLVLLNGAAARAWLAGGPPTPNPAGWLFSSGNFLLLGIAFICGGTAFFLLLKQSHLRSRTGVALLLLSLAFGVSPYARELLAQDRCLDSGGRWERGELRCVYK